ncbi:unnamed protein product [Arabis nemorensis]|uniref:Uncharacterized protein n=1 Tax=Arabis nemorensis TaxID=586526 RepID=A0A565CE75_9BRAS|nr:unnamed protein product [Arabis nemorensis]
MGRPNPNQPNETQPPVQRPPVQPTGHQNSGTMRKPQNVPPVQPTGYQNSGTMRKPQNVPTGMRRAINNASTGRPDNNQSQNLWSSDLFDCMNDSENAVITCIAPCVTFGQIAEITDEGATPCATGGLLYAVIFVFGFSFVYSCIFREKMRNKYELPDAPAPDWITHLFCEQCALCQEYRELKHRGFDPNIGWNGNVQAQQQEMMAPPTSQRMR